MAENNDPPITITNMTAKNENADISSNSHSGFVMMDPVPASPPQSINVEDMLKMKVEVENMILTHKAALEDDFRLEKDLNNTNTIEGKIRTIMEKAFWDILEEQLNEEPPNYNQALGLFQEIKRELLDLVSPTQRSVKELIEEVLDIDLVKQKLEHSAFDLSSYAKFVVDIMGRLCAPVRDEEIEKLKEIVDVVPLYREIFRVLSLMKLDLANFTLAMVRPYLKQHSVEIERKKFLEILRIQQENGVDGLQNTKIWLASSLSSLIASDSSSSTLPADASSSSSGIPFNITPNEVLNEAYLRLLISRFDNCTIAETLLVDFNQLQELRDNFGLLVLVSSILAICTSVAGQLDDEFKKKLKMQIFTITKQALPSEYRESSLAVCDQVVKELNDWLVNKRNTSVMPANVEKLLRDQMMNSMDPNVASNPVCKLMGGRLCKFLSEIIVNPALKNIDTPQGLSILSEELKYFGGQFARIISHNQTVFGTIYCDIIRDLMRRQKPSTTLQSTEGGQSKTT